MAERNAKRERTRRIKRNFINDISANYRIFPVCAVLWEWQEDALFKCYRGWCDVNFQMVGRDACIRLNRKVFEMKAGFQPGQILTAVADHTGKMPRVNTNGRSVGLKGRLG